ncbi:MAG: IPExxxVDY family protein [Bacteroidota bacterium]
MAKKVHRLLTAIDDNIGLIGLSSDESDYRLVWLINEEAGTGFIRMEDLNLYHKKLDSEQTFPLFQYYDDDSLLTYRLIGNRCENGFFLEEVKNLDFLILIQGEVFPDEMERFLEKISRVTSVRMCVPVDLNRLRSTERLYLW